MDFLEYLKKLITYKSITPYSAGSIEYVEALLKDHGFSTIIKIFGDEKYKVINLYAYYGDQNPNICFAGHLDIVPPGELDLWKNDPFEPLIYDNKIYGRGVVDMKGAVACFLAATFNFLKLNPSPKGSISFLLTTDEEGDGKYGLKEMLPYLKENNHNIDFAIIGEPTCEKIIGDIIKIGRRGSINFDLTIYGSQGHVAYPEKASNPIHKLIKILDELVEHNLDGEIKGINASNLEITSIDVGNIISNIIPESANAKFNVRFTNVNTKALIIEIIEKIIKKYTPDYKLLYNHSADPFMQEPDHYIQKFSEIVKKVTSIETKFSNNGGTSDARFIKHYASLVEFGLLSEFAHKVNEHAEISDLQSLYNVYYRALNSFLGKAT